MKKSLLFSLFTLALTLTSAFATDVPAPTKSDAQVAGPAAKGGAKLKFDGHIFAGKLFDVQKEEVGGYDKMHLTSKSGSFLVDLEVGAQYGIVRPFIKYEALTGDYDTRTAGLDVFLFSSHRVSCGLRGAYVFKRRIDIDEKSYLIAGTLCAF